MSATKLSEALGTQKTISSPPMVFDNTNQELRQFIDEP